MNLSEPLPPEEMAQVLGRISSTGTSPISRKSPYEQIDNYVKDCWEMIVSTAEWAEKDLPRVLEEVKPDVICVDNVILFPAIKRYAREQASRGCVSSPARRTRSRIRTFRRICRAAARTTRKASGATASGSTRSSSRSTTAFNAFLKSIGEKKYPLGQFFEASPAHEPAALSDAGEVQAASQAAGEAVPVSRGLRAARRRLTRCRHSRPTTTSRCSM